MFSWSGATPRRTRPHGVGSRSSRSTSTCGSLALQQRVGGVEPGRAGADDGDAQRSCAHQASLPLPFSGEAQGQTGVDDETTVAIEEVKGSMFNQKRRPLSADTGFTLIELLFVVADRRDPARDRGAVVSRHQRPGVPEGGRRRRGGSRCLRSRRSAATTGTTPGSRSPSCAPPTTRASSRPSPSRSQGLHRPRPTASARLSTTWARASRDSGAELALVRVEELHGHRPLFRSIGGEVSGRGRSRSRSLRRLRAALRPRRPGSCARSRRRR